MKRWLDRDTTMTDNDRAPNTQYPREEFITAVGDADMPVGTQDVADAVGCSYPLAYERLQELAEAGEIQQQKIGQTHIWSIPE